MLPLDEFNTFQFAALDVLGPVLEVALVILVIAVVLTAVTWFAFEIFGW
jgi:hypothetical protein